MTLDFIIRQAAFLVEFGGSLVIAVACLRSLLAMLTGLGSHYAVIRGRLLVADGVVVALGYKTAATLLKTIELQAWSSIGMFAAILTLRTVIKRVLVWEEGRLRAGLSTDVSPQKQVTTAEDLNGDSMSARTR